MNSRRSIYPNRYGRIALAAADLIAGRIFLAGFPVGPTGWTDPIAQDGFARLGLVRLAPGFLALVRSGPAACLVPSGRIEFAVRPIDPAGRTACSYCHFPWQFPQIWVIGFPQGFKTCLRAICSADRLTKHANSSL